MKKLPKLGGDGGVIAFCTEGMYRAYIKKTVKQKPLFTKMNKLLSDFEINQPT